MHQRYSTSLETVPKGMEYTLQVERLSEMSTSSEAKKPHVLYDRSKEKDGFEKANFLASHLVHLLTPVSGASHSMPLWPLRLTPLAIIVDLRNQTRATKRNADQVFRPTRYMVTWLLQQYQGPGAGQGNRANCNNTNWKTRKHTMTNTDYHCKANAFVMVTLKFK